MKNFPGYFETARKTGYVLCWMVLETFRFYDENAYEYEIFSIKGSAHA